MRLFLIFQILLFISFNSYAKNEDKNSYSVSDILQMLDKLDVFGKVLYIAAHPDDENTRFIAYLANEKKYETGYLSATRGGGGQNFIGTHLKENLGLIRTHELLQARKIDGGIQFFTSAVDFGYSKGPKESLNFWNEEKILYDFVWIIRKFKPDVIVTRFSETPGITHGHHTASTILANKAFNLSGDPNAYPDQLEYVNPWKAKRIFWNTSSRFFNLEEYDKDKMIKVDVGLFNEYLGKSYNEIASESRSMHKSQAFGALRRRGSEVELFTQLQGDVAENDIMEGIETSWKRVYPHPLLKKYIDLSRDSFDVKAPHKITPYLVSAHEEMDRISDKHWREIKKNELKKLIKATSGLFFESLSDVHIISVGETININFEIINRSPNKIKIEKIVLLDKEIILNKELINNKLFKKDLSIRVPEKLKVSEKYWLKDKPSFGTYSIDDLNDLGEPENKSNFISSFHFIIGDKKIVYKSPVQNKINNPIKGDDYKKLIVGNPVYVNPVNKMELFVNSNKKEVEVEVTSGKDDTSGEVSINTNNKIKISPESQTFNFTNKGEKKTFKFEIDLSGDEANDFEINFEAKVNNIIYNRGIETINYDHFPLQNRFPVSTVILRKFKLNLKSKKIAYYMGPGDLVPQSLNLVGYEVEEINKPDLNIDKLKNYDALIFGVRAFNVDKSIIQYKSSIMQFMEQGGNVLIQYNTSSRWNTLDLNNFVPYNLQLSRNRVSEEDAEVRIINPEHPALNFPNKITTEDFDNWIQERGLYFPNKWSKEYETLISSNDIDEDPNDGGILISKIGEGHFIYTSYSWFRQLPAGVPGAYKLFSNLLSLGKK